MTILKRNWVGRLTLGLLLATCSFGQVRGFLRIKVVEGDGAFNDIKHKVGHPLSVEVRDENGLPVAGAEVTFTAPAFGPGGTFPNGGQVMTSTTGQDGIAHADALKPNITEGRFNIAVTARQRDREGTAVIGQSNTTAGVVKSGSHKTLFIVLALAAGAGVAGAVALSGGHSNSSGSGGGGSTSTILSSGGVTVGGPK